MNRNLAIALGLVVVVVLLGGWWMKSRGHKDAPKYRTAEVARGDVTATVSATGSVEPVLQVHVGSQVSGTLAKLYVDYNSHVKAGQVLAQLETSAFGARLAQAEASVARAEAALKNGQLALQRTIALQQKGDYVAQADVDAAQAVVAQQKADVKQAQASLQSAQVDLGHTTITSPIDGVVISRSVDVGQTVAASLQAPELFLIANDLKNMQVETKIDEADIGRIRAGLPVQFTVDAFPDVNFDGVVSQVRLEPLTESNVVTYTTVISTRNEDLKLRPGMTANVTVMVETRRDVMEVPNAALRFKPAGAGGGANGQGRGGQGGPGGGANGGMRRSFGALMSRLAPPAYAQDAPPPPQGGPGNWPGANDPVVQQIREKVKNGELTREQGREQIRAYLEKKGIHMPERPPGGPGGPEGPGGPGAPDARGATGAGAPPRGDAAMRGGERAGAPPRGDAAMRGGARAGAGAPGGAPPRGEGARPDGRDGRGNGGGAGGMMAGGYKPGAVYVLRDKKPVKVRVMTGITDGMMTEVKSDSLREGDEVIVGLELPKSANSNLAPPPGMGGPQFRGPGGGRR